MEVMFYIIAGKFNPSNDDFPVKTLITKDKFADKYAQEDVFDVVERALNMAIDSENLRVENNEIDRLARMVESTLAQMRESCGINATCGEMTTH